MEPASARDAPHPVRIALREATANAHGRLDALLGHGLADAAAYAAYVRAMHRFVSDCETALSEQPLRSLWLAQDLVVLRQPPLPPQGVPRRIGDRMQRLGWEYVLAGSSLGARLLQRDAARLGHDADNGARFLARHTEGGDWMQVLGRLDALSIHDARRMAALHRGGRDAFASADTSFRRALGLETGP